MSASIDVIYDSADWRILQGPEWLYIFPDRVINGIEEENVHKDEFLYPVIVDIAKEVATLQARCDRYKAALESIAAGLPGTRAVHRFTAAKFIAIEALEDTK